MHFLNIVFLVSTFLCRRSLDQVFGATYPGLFSRWSHVAKHGLLHVGLSARHSMAIWQVSGTVVICAMTAETAPKARTKDLNSILIVEW